MDPVLIALASAAGTAVVQAAGTDAWEAFRERLARLFGRGPAPEAAEQTVLVRLDRTAAELEAAGSGAAEGVASSWTTRLRDLLEDVGDTDRESVAAELRELVEVAAQARGGVSAGDSGVAIGGDAHIDARDHSAAAMQMGDVRIGDPPAPGAASS